MLMSMESMKPIDGLYPLSISHESQIFLILEAEPLEKPETAKMRPAIAEMEAGIRCRKSQNIEKAIEHYRYALAILTSDDPAGAMRKRARILINLGNAYCDPIRGYKPDDVRLAIYAYHFALAVFDKKTFDGAKALMNLGAAYAQYTVGNKQDNLEKSIHASLQSLEILDKEKWPEDWGNAQMNLGAAYIYLDKGDKSNNAQKAKNHLLQSWKIWKREAHPHRWAFIMMNFGNVHLSCSLDNRSNSIEAAIRSYNQALKELGKQNCPYDYSSVKMNLGNAYLNRIKGDPKENFVLAVNAFTDALTVRTKENMPLDWAIATGNLGNAHLKLGCINDAIMALNSALDEIEKRNMPQEWAKFKAAIGKAYSQKNDGDRADNLKNSIAGYRDALRIFRPDTSPHICRSLARELGDLYFDNQEWAIAAEIYKIAAHADENIYHASLLSISKEAELKDTGNLYRRIGYSLAKSDQLNDAIVFLERGRARIIQEVLTRDGANLDNVKAENPGLYKKYIDASMLMRNLDSRGTDLRIGSLNRNTFVEAEFAHAHLNQVIEAIRHINGYGDFLKEANWADILKVIYFHQPFIYLLATSRGGLALIAYCSRNSDERKNVIVEPIWLEGFTESYLNELLNKNSKGSEELGFYVSFQKFWRDSSIGVESWLDSLSWVTRELWNSVMGPIVGVLQSMKVDVAFLIPFGLSALLPLHASCFVEADGKKRYALDYMAFSYAPSARWINISRQIQKDIYVNKFLAVYDSTIKGTKEEVESIAKHFEETPISVITKPDATRDEAIDQLPSAQIVHFSCHGDAVLDKPKESNLLMANAEELTVKDILDLNLPNSRLTTLSACETGIVGSALPDEVISLSTAFMRAGSAGVIAPLWDVVDDAARVMEKFYHSWVKKGLSPAQALRSAQIFVRDNKEFEDHMDWAAFYLTGV